MMKSWCKCGMSVAFLVMTLSLGESAEAVTKDYEKLFKASITSKRTPYSKYAISLYKKNESSKKWQPVLQHQALKAHTPASITKILTSVGLLEKYGLQKTLETKVYSDVKPKSKVLTGHLYVQGAGDPSFVSEKLWLLVNEIKKWGIEKIQGDLIFDDLIFDQNYLDGDRTSWNQRAYNAPLAGLSLNWNSVRVRFLDYEMGRAVVDPYNPYFDLRLKKRSNKLSQVEVRPSKGKEVLSVTLGKDSVVGEKSIYRRVNSPRDYFSSQFKEMLKQQGISFSGQVKWQGIPLGKFELGKVESESLSRLIQLMMKYSNNFIAGMLTKLLDHDYSGKEGTYKGGLVYLKAGIKKVYPFPNGLVFESSSGLSRDNKFAAEDVTQLLLELKSKTYFPELLTAFPVSCVDGTLKKRICGRKGRVRAKTGLLAGVATLAGYYRQPETEEEYVFTFMYNGKNGEQFDARKTFDHFLEAL